MILVDKEIRQSIYNEELVINPFEERLLNPSSYDIRLSDAFSLLGLSPGFEYIDPFNKESFFYEEITAQEIILPPSRGVLASTLEAITLPPNISARLLGKSSLARLFVDDSSIAAWLDPGFSASSIVLELFNLSPFPIKLYTGMPIGQLVFYLHEEVEVPYNKKKDSKYMNQAKAQGSLYFKNR